MKTRLLFGYKCSIENISRVPTSENSKDLKKRANKIADLLMIKTLDLQVTFDGMTNDNKSILCFKIGLLAAELMVKSNNLTPLVMYLKKCAGIFYGKEYKRMIQKTSRLKEIYVDKKYNKYLIKPHRVVVIEILYDHKYNVISNEHIIKYKTPTCDVRCCDNIKCNVSINLKTCSICKLVEYCSRECQKENWKIHKIECVNIKK